MLVALYKNHHQLPFWGHQANPFDVFDPQKHASLSFKGEAIVENNAIVGYKKRKLEEEGYIFSLLKGLHEVETDYLMAHVSALCDCEIQKHGCWHYPKRVWVQITNKPGDFTGEGVPNMLDIGGCLKSEIVNVWGGDNGTYTPYEFFSTDIVQGNLKNDSTLWTRFFDEQLELDQGFKSAKANVAFARIILAEAEKGLDSVQKFKSIHLNGGLSCLCL